MTRKGLDEQGRSDIQRMVSEGVTGERIREAIAHRVRSSEYNHRKNVELLDWLRRHKYNDTATFLVTLLEGKN